MSSTAFKQAELKKPAAFVLRLDSIQQFFFQYLSYASMSESHWIELFLLSLYLMPDLSSQQIQKGFCCKQCLTSFMFLTQFIQHFHLFNFSIAVVKFSYWAIRVFLQKVIFAPFYCFYWSLLLKKIRNISGPQLSWKMNWTYELSKVYGWVLGQKHP